jgi:hypothetical protein
MNGSLQNKTCLFVFTPCTIKKSEICYDERIRLDTNFNLIAYHRLHVAKYRTCVASHLCLPHHDSALNRTYLLITFLKFCVFTDKKCLV